MIHSKMFGLLLLLSLGLSGCQSDHEDAIEIDDLTKTAEHGYFLNKARDTNELILFSPEFGRTTKTNQYGYEVRVEEGVITATGGADSVIPENGFVLSGHGTAATFLTDNAIIGTRVLVDEVGRVVQLHTDLDSYFFQAQRAIAHAQTSITDAQANFLDFPKDKALAELTLARAELAEANLATHSQQAAYDLLKSATRHAENAYYLTIEVEVVEQRAIWHRPEETNLVQVVDTVKGMHDAGFNSIYLEVNFWGYTIYPSKVMQAYGMEAQHPLFKDNDYGKYGSDILAAYIGEAKKLGMTVQGWTDGFMIGSPEMSRPIPPQLIINPHWLAIQNSNKNQELIPDSKSKYFWLDIAQDEVQEYMLAIYQEMQKQYDITGLNIDYMRYPHYDLANAFSFNPITLAKYQEESGIPDLDLIQTSEQEFEKYKEWLRGKENQFVEKMSAQAKGISSEFMLTATPEPGPEEVQIADWQDDIDGVIPQAYGHDFDSIHNHVNASKKLMPEGTIYYTGIYSFYHKLGAMGTVQDVLAARYQTAGVNMFAYGQGKLLPDARQALRLGPWREPAFNPGEHLLQGVARLLADIELKLNTIYIPLSAIDKNKGESLASRIHELSVKAGAGDFLDKEDVPELIVEIDDLAAGGSIDANVAVRIKDRLFNAANWSRHSQSNLNRPFQ